MENQFGDQVTPARPRKKGNPKKGPSDIPVSAQLRVSFLFKRARSHLGETVVEDMKFKGSPLLALL